MNVNSLGGSSIVPGNDAGYLGARLDGQQNILAMFSRSKALNNLGDVSLACMGSMKFDEV